MAHATVVEKVEAHLAANWSECPVIGENKQSQAPTDGSPFLIVQYPYSRSDQMTFGSPGSNYWREEGAFLVVINVKRNTGTKTGREWAGRVAELFRGWRSEHLICRAPNSPPSDNRNESGNYFQLQFAVPYRFDYVG